MNAPAVRKVVAMGCGNSMAKYYLVGHEFICGRGRGFEFHEEDQGGLVFVMEERKMNDELDETRENG
jgi:hypothetical protein